MNDPDKVWVERSRRGDRKAFGELVSRHYEMVYAVAYGILREREAARDAAQDVFLKIFRELGRFKGDSKFKTWLYRVASNAAIDAARRRRPSMPLDTTDASEEDTTPLIAEEKGPGPRDLAGRGELREILSEALDELSPEHRAVLVLREWESLSYEEIAAALGLEPGTVMSRLFYARKKMSAVLTKKGVRLNDA